MELEPLIERYNKGTDRDKVNVLLELQNVEKSKKLAQFLLSIIRDEKYDRLKKLAIMILALFEDEETLQELRSLYVFEKEEEIRLALISKISKNPNESINKLLELAVERDPSAKIRGLALSYLNERKHDKEKMRELIIRVLEKEIELFPKIIALNIMEAYANEKMFESLMSIYLHEEKNLELKRKLAEKLRILGKKLGKEVELQVEKAQEEIPKNEKKKKKKRAKKEERDKFLYLV